MAVFLVILLGVCLVLLAAVLRHLLAVRRRVATREGVFRCKVRVTRGTVPQLSPGWPRRVCRAEWSQNVLLLHCGLWLTWAYPLAVRFAEGVIEPARPTSKVGMGGAHAVMLRLRLDDDSVIAVAAPAGARELLAGPFLAIAAQGSSPGISEQRR